MCENPNEDEFHVLFECYAYVNLRNSVLPQNLVNIRNIHSLYHIMSDSVYQRNVAKYSLYMFDRRNELMQQRVNERENDWENDWWKCLIYLYYVMLFKILLFQYLL